MYFFIKKRLSTEVDQVLPLFPWETEVTDYVEEPSGELAPNATNQDADGNTKEAQPPPSTP